MERPALITIRLEGEDGKSVPFETFALVVPNWRRIVMAFTSEYAEGLDPQWDVTSLSIGSATMGIVPRIVMTDLVVPSEDMLNRPYEPMSRALVRALSAVEQGADPFDVMPDAAVGPFNQMSKAFDDSVATIEIMTPFAGTALTAAVTTDRDFPARRVASVGSVTGFVQGVFFGRRPYFQLRNRHRSLDIKCYFDADRQYDEVVGSLRQRVEIRGRLLRDLDGAIARVDPVRNITRFVPDDELPSLSDLAGILPDLTDGLLSDEWIRRQRSGD